MIFDRQLLRTVCHGLRAAAVLAILPLTPASVHAVSPATAVVAIESTGVADLVVLGNGFNAGLRRGMVCRVSRGGSEIGEILLVELRPSCGAALILNVVPDQSIRPGDVAAVKLLKS